MDVAKLAKFRPDLVGQPDDVVVRAIAQDYPEIPPEKIASDFGLTLATPPAPGRSAMDVVKDFGLTGVKMAIGVPETAVGFADMATGGRVGKALQEGASIGGVNLRFDPNAARQVLDEQYSEPQKRAFQAVDQAEGFTGKLGAALANPSTIAHSVVESLGVMGLGGVAARGLLGVGARVMGAEAAAAGSMGPYAVPGALTRALGSTGAATVAGAAGEGLTMAGQDAEQIRQAAKDGLLTPEQVGYASAIGVLGGGIALVGGMVAKKLGIHDIDTMIAAGNANPVAQKGLVRRVLEGMFSEGVLEELPQSIMEQVLQNKAQGLPLDQGVDQAAVMGMLAGAAMGGGANIPGPLRGTKGGNVTETGAAASGLAGNVVPPQTRHEPPVPTAAPLNPAAGPLERAAATTEPAAPLPTSDDLKGAVEKLTKAAEEDPFSKPAAPVHAPIPVVASTTPQADEDPFSAPLPSSSIAPGAQPAVASEIDAAAHEAATSPLNERPEPTDAQKEAGNYKKGHVNVQGLDVTIENPQGSTRSGQRPDGTTWEHEMSNHYGYIKRTEGADGEHVDVYVGPKPDAPNVWIVDQVNQHDASFDEHKVMLGFASRGAAINAYRSNFDKGWILGRVTEMPVDQFKEWLKNGDLKKPASPKGPLNVEGQPNANAQAPADAGGPAVPGGAATQLPGNAARDGAQPEGAAAGLAGPDAQGAAPTEAQPHPADAAGNAPGGRGAVNAAGTESQEGKGQAAQAAATPAAPGTAASTGTPGAVEAAGEPVVEHVTTKGKRLTGYVRTLTEAQAKEIDPYAIRKPAGQWFLRKERADAHAQQAAQSAQRDVRAEGREAFTAGEQRIPPQEMTSAQMKDWLAGWDEANIAKPVEEKPQEPAATAAPKQPEDAGAPATRSGTRSFKLSNGSNVRVGDEAQTGYFHVRLNDDGNNWTSIGTFRMDGAGQVSGIKSRANWTEKIVTEAANTFAAMQRGETTNVADAPMSKPAEAKGPMPAPEPAPQPKPANADALRAQADLNNALADLGDFFGKPFRANIAPEQEAKLIPILTRVLDAAFRLGYHKFKDAAKFALDKIREALGAEAADAITLDHLQGAYIAMSGGRAGADTKRAVIDIEDKAEIEGHTAQTYTPTVETPANSADTAAKEPTNANAAQPEQLPAGGPGQAGQDAAAGNGNRQQVDAGVAEGGANAAEQGSVPPGPGGAGGKRARGVQPAGKQSPGEARGGGAVRAEGGAADRVGDPATAPTSDRPKLDDFNIDAEDIGKGGLTKKYADNVAAIRILKAMTAESRAATPDERRSIARYVGWGALKGVFDPANEKWAKQHAELKELLTEAEWKAARASTLNAHFTSPTVVSAMYEALQKMGVQGANRMLEPSVGVGNFFGLMPEALRKVAVLHGVELDPLTSQIAAALYPSAKITNSGFEDFQIPSEFFDVVIGNPPFGNEPIVDMERSSYSGFSVHNYFLAKSIDKLRPGGIGAFVVSHNFMDAQNSATRKWLADRADLLAAVRLPDTAFKANAGTEVVTDIVFLRKRAHDEKASDTQWLDAVRQTNTNPKTGETAEHWVNQYFQAHPENILGEASAGGTMYGPNQYTVRDTGGDLADKLTRFVNDAIPEQAFEPIDRTKDMQASDVVIPSGVKVGSFFVDGKGQVRQRTPDSMGAQTSAVWTPPNNKAEQRMRGMIGLRDALRDQMRMERDPDATEAAIEANRQRLGTLYDAFRKDFGYLNDPTNRRIFLDDTDAALVQMLEFNYDRGVSKAVAEKEGSEPRPPSSDKADIFRMRVAFPPSEDVHPTSAKDALLASLNLKGRVDMEFMSRVYDRSAAEIVDELGDLVFEDPLHGIIGSDEYLAGDVKTKLEEAKAAAAADPKYQRNVDALEKVIPADKMPSEIHAALGASFVPPEVYGAFAQHVTGSNVQAYFMRATGQWVFNWTGAADRTKNEAQWGTQHVSAQKLMELTMSGRTPIVTKTVRVGTSTQTVVLEAETEEARSKQNTLKEEWQRWLWDDGERADRIAAIYNDKLNRIVDRQYDGRHLTLPGKNPAITLLDHQLNGVWRGLQSRQMLLDHVVGAGKTYQMAAIAMEMRRLGIARKPLLAVPNHLTLQWRDEFARLYPGSKILAATPEDFAKDARERFFSKIVTGDWDAVIVGHSSLKKIGLPAATERAVLEEQVQEIGDAIEDMKRSRGDRNIVRDMENIRKRLEARMKERLSDLGERDKVLSFDELGLDALMVDELHEFKNLFYNSTMDRNPGMGNPSGSDKAFDLFVKIHWLFDTYGEQAPLITATGTPVSNSLVEMFNMQRFMQYPTLKEAGLHTFDGWANQFGNVESVYEVSPSGTGYRTASRFAKFKNLPALMALYRSFADTITLDDLKEQEALKGERFPVPKMKTGRPMLVVAKRSPAVAEFMGVPHLAIDEGGNVKFGINLGRGESARIEEKNGQWHALRLVETEGGKPTEYILGTFNSQEQAALAVVQKALTPDITVDPNSILGQFANLRALTRASNGKVNALSLTGLANKAGLDYRLIDPTAPDFKDSKVNQAVANAVQLWKDTAADRGTQLIFCDLSTPQSARSGFAGKPRLVYVRGDAGEVVHRRGTLHTAEGQEQLPFIIAQRTEAKVKVFDVHDAASGLKARSGFSTKSEALAWATATVQDESMREKWIAGRERAGEIDQVAIDDYNNEHEIDLEEVEFISRSDIAGVSGSSRFSVYDDMRSKLVAAGVPEREIAFIHDYGTPTAKAKLWNLMNTGAVRFLFGSTPKLGAGTNVQKRLVGLHHIDAPWRPSDLEQREGRILRRGNELYERDPDGFEVSIWRYATEQTYDTRRWQLIEHKARVVEQLRKFDGTTNEIEDVDGEASNAADMKAAASGDPLILEETKLRTEIKRLEHLRSAHADAVSAMRRNARSNMDFVERQGPQYIQKMQGMLDTVAEHPEPEEGVADTVVNGIKAKDKDDAIRLIQAGIKRTLEGVGATALNYRGLNFTFDSGFKGFDLRDPSGFTMDSFKQDEAISPSGFLSRFANYIGRIPGHIEQTKAEIATRRKDAQGMLEQAGKPWGEGELLEAARTEYRKIQRQLIAKGPEVPEAEKPTLQKALREQRQTVIDEGWGDALREFEGNAEAGGFTEPVAGSYEPSLNTQVAHGISGLGNDTDVVFRQDGGAGTATGRLVGELQAVADPLATATGTPVDVVASVASPAVPKPVRDEARRRIAAGGQVPSAVFYDGRVIIFADRTPNEQTLIESVLHETYGHKGLRGRFGPELDAILRQIVQARPAQVAAVIARTGMDPSERLRAAEEVLAEMAQKNPQLGFVRRAIAAIRTFLRGLGLKLKLSDDEIIRSFLIPAREFVQARASRSSIAPGALAFNQPDATNTEAFRKWFGDSKVVDADGKPLRVYHGTPNGGFSELNGERGIFFTDSANVADGYTMRRGMWRSPGEAPAIYPAYLSMQNPLVVDALGKRNDHIPVPWQEWKPKVFGNLPANAVNMQAALDYAREHGHDGLIVRNVVDTADVDGKVKSTVYAVLNPEQAKSATGNSGTFDAGNPDIRFNQSANVDVRTVFDRVMGNAREYAATPGKLNWWHKTFGTPFNLAQRSPAFAKVYDRVQEFLNDVSRYATEAADLAPRILPKLEGWKGMFTSPLKGADAKAIAAPIFEGTLAWTRDIHGNPSRIADNAIPVHDMAQLLLRNGDLSPEVLRMWRGLPIEQYEKLVEASFKKNAAGIVWSDAELRTQFGLTDERIGLYKEFRAAVDKSINDLVRADIIRYGGADLEPVRDAIMAAPTLREAGETARDYLMSLMDLTPDRRAVLRDMADRAMAKANKGERLQQRGYAPLSRFGKYTLDVVDADGERVYFGLFESRLEARRMQSKMEAMFPGSTIRRGTTSEEEHKLFAGMTPETAELFGEMLGLEPDGEGAANVAFQEFIKRTKNQRSAMKRLIERKGIAGFSEDVSRVLAGFVYSNSRQIAQSLHTKAISEAAQDIPQGQGELKDAAIRLVRYVQDPQEEAHGLRGLLFAQYLGGSVAAMVVNMFQPLQITMPYLSRFGGIRAAARVMRQAAGDVWKANLEDGLRQALQHAVEDGTVAPQEVHQLMAYARGRGGLQSDDGTALGKALAMGHNTLARVVHGWGQPFALAELFNRRITFIAAYRLAVQQGIADPAAFAKDAVDQTQFTYNKGNKPELGRGPVGSVLLTFKQYGISYLELLQRMWNAGPEGKKSAVFMLAMLALMGGAGGLPFEDDILDLVDGIGQRLGYNMRSKHARGQFLESVFGKTFGNFVDKGVSGIPGMPVDVAARFGMSNLIPGTGLLTKKEDHTRDVTEILGPAGDMATRVFQAGNQLAEGNLLQAGLSVAPKAASNWAKAAEMANLGYYTDAKGRKVIATDGWDAASKFIGFQPNAVAQTQQATADVQQMVAMARMKESEIADRIASALFKGDSSAAQSAREEVTAWNRANPESPIRIGQAQIKRRLRDMHMDKEQRLAKAAPKEVRAEVLRELREK